MNSARRVLFFRDFRGFTGGHLKVWHYFCHLATSGRYRPEIIFGPDSQLDPTNPWIANHVPVLRSWEPTSCDMLFLAGLDWIRLPESQRLGASEATIVNLIQSVRHADPADLRYPFLKRLAIRICVSDEVRDAVAATGVVNGPVWTVRAATDLVADDDGGSIARRDTSLLIAGYKNSEFARQLSSILDRHGIGYRLLVDRHPRDDYLRAVRDSVACVFLPCPTEGFYLPPLEAMAFGTLVVCPDCIGNRGHCIDKLNCLRPRYTLEHVFEAIRELDRLPALARDAMRRAGIRTAAQHTLAAERTRVLEIFDDAAAGMVTNCR